MRMGKKGSLFSFHSPILKFVPTAPASYLSPTLKVSSIPSASLPPGCTKLLFWRWRNSGGMVLQTPRLDRGPS